MTAPVAAGFRPLSGPVHGIANFRLRSLLDTGMPSRFRKDVEGIRKPLQSRNVKFRESIVPRTGDTQIFLYDPDGVGVELNFPGA